MQLSRRALFRSILPLSALAASIAASLKSPQAAPPETTGYFAPEGFDPAQPSFTFHVPQDYGWYYYDIKAQRWQAYPSMRGSL